ncbi:PEPA protein, partial [Anhinga anhinga]|nr:PEPA protein [Anhinga anhinga]
LFGAIDPSYTTNGIKWIPLSAETYWQITMDRYVSISGQPVVCSSGCQAIVDTGTSLLAMPNQDLNTILEALGVGSNGEISCHAISSLPDIVFHINGYAFPLTPSAYVIEVSISRGADRGVWGCPAAGNHHLPCPRLQTDGVCMLGLQGMDVPTESGELWILGDVFIRE